MLFTLIAGQDCSASSANPSKRHDAASARCRRLVARTVEWGGAVWSDLPRVFFTMCFKDMVSVDRADLGQYELLPVTPRQQMKLKGQRVLKPNGAGKICWVNEISYCAEKKLVTRSTRWTRAKVVSEFSKLQKCSRRTLCAVKPSMAMIISINSVKAIYFV